MVKPLMCRKNFTHPWTFKRQLNMDKKNKVSIELGKEPHKCEICNEELIQEDFVELVMCNSASVLN